MHRLIKVTPEFKPG